MPVPRKKKAKEANENIDQQDNESLELDESPEAEAPKGYFIKSTQLAAIPGGVTQLYSGEDLSSDLSRAFYLESVGIEIVNDITECDFYTQG